MDEMLGRKHFTTLSVLITSFPEDTPGPSAAVGEKEEEEQEEKESQQTSGKRKRERDNTRLQRNVEERTGDQRENGQALLSTCH